MTVATVYQAMIAITVNTAIGTIVRRAVHIAGCAIRLYALAVLMNVLYVMSRSVGSVPPNAKSAKRRFARTV